MSDHAQKYSEQYLRELGVEVHLKKMVKDYDGHTLTFTDGTSLVTYNVVWAAGVTGIPVPGIPEDAIVRGNRIRVDQYHRVEAIDEVFALGDIAYMETPDFPHGHPQLANVAIGQAKNLAKNLKLESQGKPLIPYRYKNRGSMATVGKRKAVVDLPKIKFHGQFAWVTWMLVHFWLILSVRNKIVVFVNWISEYFNNDSTLRIILRANYSKAKNNLLKHSRKEVVETPKHEQVEELVG